MLRIPFLFGSLLALASLGFTAGLAAAEKTFSITVEAGKFDRQNVPVKTAIAVPAELAKAKIASLTGGDGLKLVGQLTASSLLSEAPDTDRRELHFIVPELKAGQSLSLTAKISDAAATPAETFAWTDEAGKQATLSFAGKPVLRYMYETLDESTPARREETFKVYHHVFDPAGKQIVTKGPGGVYTHHRGLFYGFNKISYQLDGANKSADIWHCRGAHMSHEAIVAVEEGPVLGRHRLAINWHGPDKGIFAKELREMTAYRVPGGTLIEFASHLTSQVGSVKLDGDPQHAGFHFRAAQEVADKSFAQTIYLRPDGQDQPGKTRNWPDDPKHIDLAWNAMSFVLGDQRFTCCYLDRPTNPKEARFSERNYGRFGSYFKFELNEATPLDVNYRIWLQPGEMTGAQVDSLSRGFVEPPLVQVKS